MKNTIKTVLALFILLVCITDVFAGEYVVIVNTGNSISEIPKSNLKRIFTGKMKEFKGVKLVPINLPPESETGTAFLSAVVGMDGSAYKEFWVQQQVKGLGSAPMIQKTSDAVVAMVSQIPGAIGYIEKSKATDAVKVITVK